MTPLRSLAVGVSGFVARRASRRAKEWAEGLAREVEFVESDWLALRWALGSVRILVRNLPEPLRNASEIARAGRLFAGSREHVPPMIFLIMMLQALNSGLQMFPIGRVGYLQRVGFAIAAVSAAYVALVGWMDHRMGERPDDMDDGSWIEFYMREMVRLRDLYAGFGSLNFAALAVFIAGGFLGVAGMTRPYLSSCLIAFLMFVVWKSPRPAERLQRKIDELDSILRQSGSEA